MGKWSCWLAALTLLTQPAFAELRSGTKAPDFRLEALTGGAVMLTIQKEKLVITVTQTEKEDKVVQRNAKVALLHFFQPT